MAAAATVPGVERSVILDDVSWETYERLLAENESTRSKRFTYDNGTLQIMVISRRHERPNHLLELIVEIVAEAWDLSIDGSGAMTIKRADLLKGFEPDSCFYIRNVEAVEGKIELDFTVDPPPDLVIEVDITHDSVNKFPLVAALGVPEVWRYDGSRVSIHLLRNARYELADRSEMLSPLSASVLTAFVAAGLTEKRPLWIRRVREWAQAARK